MLANGGRDLTLILLTWTIWRAPTNASKWRTGFNSAFKGLNFYDDFVCVKFIGHSLRPSEYLAILDLQTINTSYRICTKGLLVEVASRSHSDTLHSTELLWTSDQLES